MSPHRAGGRVRVDAGVSEDALALHIHLSRVGVCCPSMVGGGGVYNRTMRCALL